MSEINQEQVQQIQKKAAFDSVLRKFQMILIVELVLSSIFFCLRKERCKGQRIHLFWGWVHGQRKELSN
jgi:hypothetical protein